MGQHTKYIISSDINNGYNTTSVTGDKSNIFVAENSTRNSRGEISYFVINVNNKKEDYIDGVKYKGIIFNADKWIDLVVYSKNAGIFYVSGNIIGYVAGKEIGNQWSVEAIEFFETPNPQIILRDNELYIYLSNVKGVIKIKGVDKFKDYFGHFSNARYIRGSITLDKLKEHLNTPLDPEDLKYRAEVKADVEQKMKEYYEKTPAQRKKIDDEISQKEKELKKYEKLSESQNQ